MAEWEVRMNENQMDLWLFYTLETIIILYNDKASNHVDKKLPEHAGRIDNI